jgi:CheY-like chemotaxis protein
MSTRAPTRHRNILLVEDNPGDVMLTEEALREADTTVRLHVVEDGTGALAFLRGEGEHAGAPPPDLVLLDLNLPGMDGREVLERMRADARLRSIPVVVLSTSDAGSDVSKCHELGANSYVKKPTQLEDFFRAVQRIWEYWFTLAKLPELSERCAGRP